MAIIQQQFDYVLYLNAFDGVAISSATTASQAAKSAQASTTASALMHHRRRRDFSCCAGVEVAELTAMSHDDVISLHIGRVTSGRSAPYAPRSRLPRCLSA